MLKKILLALLCSLLGAIFIFSGYTKLYPIEPFEYTFVDLGFVNWQIAPFVARILIGLEFLIGVLLLFNVQLRKLGYKLGIFVLLIFCLYLILLITLSGNKGNCGCFGSYISMTPLQALAKNIFLLGLFLILYKYHIGWELKNKLRYLISIPFLTAFAFPFILNPVELNYSEAYLSKPENNFKLELDSLYNNATLNVPPRNLSQGKHIISFMSLTCPHCRIAANKIRIIHERNAAIPFYFILNGDEENLKPFFENTHTEDIPHCILLGRNFIYLAGTSMPMIYLVNNSEVEHVVNYMDLDQKEIEEWLSK
jgi:uncharacterized membrane protein YphA (DoxX/SURF4 family)